MQVPQQMVPVVGPREDERERADRDSAYIWDGKGKDGGGRREEEED